MFYSKDYNSDRIFSSIFFGGGTPSLMQPEYLAEIITSLKQNYSISDVAEITMETNPGTVDMAKLKKFRQIGINRISIGIQSFNDDELKFLTRIHDKSTAIQTVLEAHAIGFENISIDLIFNLPKQSKDKWESNLQIAMELPINHISTYSLILERGTILNKMVLDGKVTLQDEDYDAELYEMTIDSLTQKGFLQYEVSNFTKAGYECRHNNAYWRYKDYLSFGPSSHSFVNRKRWWNYSSLKRYISEIYKNGTATAGFELINDEMALNEYVMLAMRSKGLDTNEFISLFGGNWLVQKNDFFHEIEKGRLGFMNNGIFQLTKSGYAVCDEILSKLL